MSTETEVPPEVPVETPDVPLIEDLVRAELADTMDRHSDRVMQRLANNCLALKVTVTGAMQECKIDGVQVTVEGKEIEPSTLGRTTGVALPKEVKQILSRVASQVRQVPGRLGTKFPGGAYLIPIRAAGDRRPAEQVLSEIGRLREEYKQAARECRPAWEAHMEKLKTENEPVWKRVHKVMPDGEHFIQAHQINTMMYPLGKGLPTTFWGQAQNLLTQFGVPQPDALIDELKKLVHEPDRLGDAVDTANWVRDTREASDRLMREAVSSMIGEPLRELAETIANIEGQMLRSTHIRQGTIDRIRAAWDKLTAFQFMLPPELMARMEVTGRRLAHLTAADVNANVRAGTGELVNFFREVRLDLSSPETVGSVVGRAVRSIDLD